MLEENLAAAEGGEVAMTFATGMAAVSGALGVLTATGDQIVAHQTLYGCTHSLLTSWLPRYKICTNFCHLTKPESLGKSGDEELPGGLSAENSYPITLAVSRGQIKTLIENPFSMTHASLPEDEKIRSGLQPGGMRLSLGLEDWHDIIAELPTSKTCWRRSDRRDRY